MNPNNHAGSSDEPTTAEASATNGPLKRTFALRIGSKLLLVFLVVVAGFAAVAWAYQSLIEVENVAEARGQELDNFQTLGEEAYLIFLQARRYEKELPLYRDEKYIGRHASSTTEIKDRLQRMKTLEVGSATHGLLDSMLPEVDRYGEDMADFARALQFLGLFQDQGLRHHQQVAADAIANIMARNADDAVQVNFLRMRAQERDFLVNQDPVFLDQMLAAEAEYMESIDSSELLTGQDKGLLRGTGNVYVSNFIAVSEGYKDVKAAEDVVRAQAKKVVPLFDNLRERVAELRLAGRETLALQTSQANQNFVAVLAVVGIVIAIALAVLGLTLRRPLRRLGATVQKVADGDYDARTNLTGTDELGDLGVAFDRLLGDRVSTLAAAEAENEQLNVSIINLLQAVAKLARRDLTVKVPVTEDITGPVADSLNLLTTETAKVLTVVNTTAHEVATVSHEVKRRSDSIVAVSTREVEVVAEASRELGDASTAMLRIAKLAQACNIAAGKTASTTESAQTTVLGTVEGINGIRSTIHETEKRIKRLGERSQEIGTVVGLINGIAERTQILALNASMHAASAGEAGRAFAVVAEEVQRLAENARESTSKIDALVSSIQSETAGTVDTMNEAITRVVQGTELAEQAGAEMQTTRESTAQLLKFVQRIARESRAQVESTARLQRSAEGIERTTTETNAELKGQAVYTDQLVDYCDALVNAVSVFTLPDSGKVPAPVASVTPIDSAQDTGRPIASPITRAAVNG